jgi:hypothetical protein
MKTKNTTTTETHKLLSAHHDESAVRLKKLQDRLTTLRAETNTTPLLGDAFRPGEVPLKQTPAPLPDWMEWVEDRPIVCGLIAAAIGLTGGLIVGANI